MRVLSITKHLKPLKIDTVLKKPPFLLNYIMRVSIGFREIIALTRVSGK